VTTSDQAVVARLRNRDQGTIEYLGLTTLGAPNWSDDPVEATVFSTRRSAALTAAQLPARNRAFPLLAPIEAIKLPPTAAR
jgi:hypothetical protein